MKVIHITFNFWVVSINNWFSHKITGNGPRIGDSGGLESQNFQFCTKLSNSLLLFSKFIKKGNIKGCCDKKRGNFQFLPYPAIEPNACVCPAYAGHTPKAFQIVQKYKFSFTNQVFGVLFFQRVQVPYERIENLNR